MTFKFIITPALRKFLDKMAYKDKKLVMAVRKKMAQIICSDITFFDHFKNLRRAAFKDIFRIERIIYNYAFTCIYAIAGGIKDGKYRKNNIFNT